MHTDLPLPRSRSAAVYQAIHEFLEDATGFVFPPGTRLAVYTVPDGFLVRSFYVLDDGFVILTGLARDGRDASRLIHADQVNLEVRVLPDEEEAGPRREMGIHAIPEILPRVEGGRQRVGAKTDTGTGG